MGPQTVDIRAARAGVRFADSSSQAIPYCNAQGVVVKTQATSGYGQSVQPVRSVEQLRPMLAFSVWLGLDSISPESEAVTNGLSHALWVKLLGACGASNPVVVCQWVVSVWLCLSAGI